MKGLSAYASVGMCLRSGKSSWDRLTDMETEVLEMWEPPSSPPTSHHQFPVPSLFLSCIPFFSPSLLHPITSFFSVSAFCDGRLMMFSPQFWIIESCETDLRDEVNKIHIKLSLLSQIGPLLHTLVSSHINTPWHMQLILAGWDLLRGITSPSPKQPYSLMFFFSR